MKDKYIALALALVVVFGIFFKDSLQLDKYLSPDSSPENPSANTSSTPTEGFVSPTFDIPGISGVPVGLQAWNVFEEYIASAKAHDLEGVRKHSYQLSPACLDPQKTAECTELMDSVVFFTDGWKQTDFVNVAYDDKQIVLSTNYIKEEGAEDGVKTVLYFIRGSDTMPKLLSIRFCLGDNDSTYSCVETDPTRRDKDANGWWDDVENLFRK